MKTEIVELIGPITDLTRLKSSANGNPKYQIVIGGRVVITKSDSCYVYSITNFNDGKPCKVTAKYTKGNKLILIDVGEV